MGNTQITFIGAGNMAASLIGGLCKQGVPAQSIRASDPGAAQLETLHSNYGVQTFSDNGLAVKDADIIVLAVKPQVMRQVCEQLAPYLTAQQLVISIAAGITCSSLSRWLGINTIVRCMPNTPSLIQQGVSGLYATEHVSAVQREQAEQLLSAVGLAVWLDNEQLIDAVTAVSGSGPAYFFLLIEAMTQAGIKLGLPADTAAQLAQYTAQGASTMACQSPLDAAQLRKQVTSPNGTTEAAIHAFQAGGFSELVETAVRSAATRSQELAQQLSE
ncbi:MAG TPA: pyrroline-5-carboxylate reductase [Thiopseudomonas sp.]|nr:pyrroline-5-carboxylate reductase [Thiopseudomonas sp.]